MLLRAAKFVSKCWQENDKKIVTIVGRDEMTADRLQNQFCDILKNPSRQQRGLLLYGDIRVRFMGRSRFCKIYRLLGIQKKDPIYFDHTAFDGDRYCWIPKSCIEEVNKNGIRRD